MVYCGRPSTACDRCRTRRIRCDRKTPSCTQCGNAGVTCSGYRDPLNLIFRHQTSATMRERGSHTVIISKSTRSSPDRGLCDQTVADDDFQQRYHNKYGVDLSVLATMSPKSFYPCQNPSQMTQDVISTFLLLHGAEGSHFEYLPVLFDSISRGDPTADPLFLSILSVGLVCLGNMRNDSGLFQLAELEHVKALALVNESLRFADTAKKDSTLASVLLLSLFETFLIGAPLGSRYRSKDDKDLDKAWSKHVAGAAALLELRGENQLKDRMGLALFKQTYVYINVHCVQRGRRMSPKLVSLYDRAVSSAMDTTDSMMAHINLPRESFEDPNIMLKACRQLAYANRSFASLQMAINEGTLTDPIAIFAWAKQLDDIVVECMIEAPPSHNYMPYSTQLSDYAAFNSYRSVNCCNVCGIGEHDDMGIHHTYQTLSVARFWNGHRMLRAKINEMILTVLPQMRRQSLSHIRGGNNQSATARANIELMVTEICASIPTGVLCSPTKPPDNHLAMAYSLIWPIYVAGSMSISTKIREYTIRLLEHLGGKCAAINASSSSSSAAGGSSPLIRAGIDDSQRYQIINVPPALEAAKKLKNRDHDETWMHLCYVF